MTLHFGRFQVPSWLSHAHVDRAVSLVWGVIGVSLCFGALRIVDSAVSGALVDRQAAVAAPDRLIASEPPSAGSAADTSIPVDMPPATVEAIGL